MSASEKPVAQIQVTSVFSALEVEAEIYQMPDGSIYLGSGLCALPLTDSQLATLRKMLDRHARHFSLITG